MYYIPLSLFHLILLLPTKLAGLHSLQVQSRQVGDLFQDQGRSDAVKEAFTHAWRGYYQFAFPNDELKPVTNSVSNSRNGWGATAIDAFSTALVMKIPEIVNQILEYIPTINFDKTDSEVVLFETTIRYLGGLLSGYDLLTGPLSTLASNPTAVAQILTQAKHLADNLAFAFNTTSGIPSNRLNLVTRSPNEIKTVSLAAAGSLVLEWTHLSDLTGNPSYASLSQKAESNLLNPQPPSSEPWPGLIGSTVNIETGLLENAFGGWGSGSDSFYEYLIKMYAYDQTRFANYRERWILAADSSIAHLASHPSSRPDLTFLALFDGPKILHRSQHLACFDGGSFILGGLILKEPKYIDFGLELVNACHETYVHTLTGIGPETFSWVTNKTPLDDQNNPQPPADQAEFYAKAGFYITGGKYVLRPEVIESFYYAYRATHNQMYQDWAWNAFVAMNSTCRTDSGFSQILDVNAPNGGGLDDFQDSFLFAEVLKYSYLIFAPEEEWQVEHDGLNPWIYNTEAHPFRAAGPPV
ncbi:putative mannosyl-oligosaccharide alpha-1,2-mannosidase [Podosphaera aphanis]|nr:putative mannosyl-oligosaccharide alpha-1,2-mannosidase [Podosphaera aphanis]